MSFARDAATLVIVFGLAAAYAVMVHTWLAARDDGDRAPAPQEFGEALLLGVLFLALVNYLLSVIAGSVVAAVAVLLIPLGSTVPVAANGRWRARVLRQLKAAAAPAVVAACTSAGFALSIAYPLFSSEQLTRRGTLHPDLLVHIGLAAQQAFQSSPGYVPLSPIAFPGPMPFVPFAADSLVAATFRYLPFAIHAFDYPQVVFCWVAVLLTAMVLVADSRPGRGALILTTSLLVVPILVWHPTTIGNLLMGWFHANPNSALARPIGLALAFHFYRCFLLGVQPRWSLLTLVPAASLIFKSNQAVAFALLQLVGFAVCQRANGFRHCVKPACIAVGAWIAAIALTKAVAQSWLVPIQIAPSTEHLWHYAGIAIPALHQMHSFGRLIQIFATYLLTTALVAWASIAVSSRWGAIDRPRGAVVREVAVPVAVLASGMAYLLLWWWTIVPAATRNGEPLHVNFELIAALMTPPIAFAVSRVYDRRPHPVEISRTQRVSMLVVALAALAFWANSAWPPMKTKRDFSSAFETRIRLQLIDRIPDGHCFSYHRRYAIYVNEGLDPDFAIASTGCPVLNGRRFRGLMGTNDAEILVQQSTIEVPSGPAFQVVESRPCTGPPDPPGRFAVDRLGSGLKFSWAPARSARSYVIEAGSAPGLSDVARVTVKSGTTRLDVPLIKPGTYFVSIRGDGPCGPGLSSKQQVVVR